MPSPGTYVYRLPFFILVAVCVYTLLAPWIWAQRDAESQTHESSVVISRLVDHEFVPVTEQWYIDGHTYRRLHLRDNIALGLVLALLVLAAEMAAEARQRRTDARLARRGIKL